MPIRPCSRGSKIRGKIHGPSKDQGEPRTLKRRHRHKKTSFSRSVRRPRLGRPVMGRELSVPGDDPHPSAPGHHGKSSTFQDQAPATEPEQIFSSRFQTEQAVSMVARRKLFHLANDPRPDRHPDPLDTDGKAILVEPDGIEPTTPCLQSRCSPS